MKIKMNLRGEITAQRYQNRYKKGSSLNLLEYCLRTMNNSEGKFLMDYYFANILLNSAFLKNKVTEFKYILKEHSNILLKLNEKESSIFHYIHDEINADLAFCLTQKIEENKNLQKLVNRKNIFGISPLINALMNEMSTGIDYLVQWGAYIQPDEYDELRKLVERWIRDNKVKNIELLIKANFKKFEELLDSDKNNILHLAVFSKNTDFVKIFKQKSPKCLDQKNVYDLKPYDIAKKLNIKDLIWIFKDNN